MMENSGEAGSSRECWSIIKSSPTLSSSHCAFNHSQFQNFIGVSLPSHLESIGRIDQSTAMAYFGIQFDIGGKKHIEIVTYILQNSLESCLLLAARSSLEVSNPLFSTQVANKEQQKTWNLTCIRRISLQNTQKIEP
jgi:hypothetical protein